MFELKFKFSKSINCLGVSEPIKWLAAQRTAYTLRNRQSKQAFVKENAKEI